MDDRPKIGFRDCPMWLFGAAGLVLAQVGLALALFGPTRAWSAVTDDRPILSGRHPLHLYHGTLGAAAFRSSGVTTCYDPSFQAGYPKTPVFDGGSRPAELVLFLGGGTYRPAAYKLGLFALILLVPVAFICAARGADLPAGAAVLAGAGGTILAWSEPVRRMLVEGQLDVLAAGLAAVVFVPWLARFARTHGVDAWLVLAGTAVAGWYFHPLVWLGLGPVVLAYYLVFAPRHGPAWHLGLAGITFVGVAPNAWWLVDWGKYWWLRQPPSPENFPIPGLFAVIGNPLEYPALFGRLPCGFLLMIVGIAGAVSVWRAGHRAAAGLHLFAAGLTIAFARAAGAWPAVPPDVPDRMIVLAAGFLVPTTAFALWTLLTRVRVPVIGTAAIVTMLLIVGWIDGRSRPLARAAGVATEPLQIGFTDEQTELIALLKHHTTPEARILWDETSDRPGWNWSALLPLLTERPFLGGLDPESRVEHAFCSLSNRQLAGRSLNEWSDAELEGFCRWYNIGWVVARSPAAMERWGRFPAAKPVGRLTEGGVDTVIFELARTRSFVLSGSANWDWADTRRITLTDVNPNPAGELELSVHWLNGLRAYPSYVQVEAMQNPNINDPVPHVRLRLPGPVPRVTLVWENP